MLVPAHAVRMRDSRRVLIPAYMTPENSIPDNPELVVVGGGIHGAMTAWDAALRGIRVLLLERGCFGEGTTANSLRIVHGGLRYLQQLDLRRMRTTAREQRAL